MAMDCVYRFGLFELNLAKGSLFDQGKPARLGDRALQILIALVERAGEVVSHQELIERVWPSTFVEESNLRVHLTAIRKALHEGRDQIRYIANVHGRGYRFVAQVVSRTLNPIAKNAPSNLPGCLTELLGRSAFLHELVDEVAVNRLVTITGAGGIGKTGIALALAHELSPRFKAGVRFVDLSRITDPNAVLEAAAAALGISGLNLAAIWGHLRDENMLIVLDNCEHVIDAAAELVEAVLKWAPGVRILATSREPLRAEGERIRRLPPLDIPPTESPICLAEALSFPSAQLFVDRARACCSGFEPTDQDGPLLAILCERLAGIPLALELAAARVDTFGLAGLIADLDDPLSLLTRGRRTAPRRHRSLRANLDWSFDLLPEVERTMLMRLAAYQTAFSLEDAILAAAVDGMDAQAVLDGVACLSQKSLIVIEYRDGWISYRLLHTTRAYAFEKFNRHPDFPLTTLRNS
jgi:predicted ATPase/DNA-binding winged helix-turn-helix (wHTH) protein